MANPNHHLHPRVLPVIPVIWKKACQEEIEIPVIGSKVFYFRSGHSLQCLSVPDFGTIPSPKTYFLCRVTGVGYHADPMTDELFLRISLQPVEATDPDEVGPVVEEDDDQVKAIKKKVSRTDAGISQGEGNQEEGVEVGPVVEEDDDQVKAIKKKVSRTDAGISQGEGNQEEGVEVGPIVEEDDDQVKAIKKKVSRTDAGTSQGFKVPIKCVKEIFPPLEYDEDPSDMVEIRDLLGFRWQFRYCFSYSGGGQHRLLGGWTEFANSKNLVAGDTLVFIKYGDEIFVAISKRYHPPLRGGRRVSPLAVVNAVRAANDGREFEVDFYPGPKIPEFVVAEQHVGPHLVGSPFVKNKIVVDRTGRRGTVEDASTEADGSPWQMLEVRWEGADDLSKVNPWEVEEADPTFNG